VTETEFGLNLKFRIRSPSPNSVPKPYCQETTPRNLFRLRVSNVHQQKSEMISRRLKSGVITVLLAAGCARRIPLTVGPDCIEPIYGLGNVYRDQALAQFERVIRLSPQHSSAYFSRASIQAERRQLFDAFADLQKATSTLRAADPRLRHSYSLRRSARAVPFCTG